MLEEEAIYKLAKKKTYFWEEDFQKSTVLSLPSKVIRITYGILVECDFEGMWLSVQTYAFLFGSKSYYGQQDILQ